VFGWEDSFFEYFLCLVEYQSYLFEKSNSCWGKMKMELEENENAVCI